MADSRTIAIGTKDSKMEFTVSQPFDEGHVCTAAEAKVLNQVRRENLGNNFRAKVQATLAGEEGAMTESALRSAFAEADASYVFTEASVGGGVTMTPLEKEARKVARDIVILQLAQSGRKRKEVSKEAFEAEVARFAEHDGVQKIAARNLKDRDNLASRLLEAAE